MVVERATNPVWSPTGHLLFSRDGAVLAVAFDPRSGTLRGAAVPVLPSGAIERLGSGQLALALSSTGTLVFAPVDFNEARVVSVNRNGAALALDLLPSKSVSKPSDLAGRATAPGRNWWQRHRGARPCAWHAGTAYGGDAERHL